MGERDGGSERGREIEREGEKERELATQMDPVLSFASPNPLVGQHRSRHGRTVIVRVIPQSVLMITDKSSADIPPQ